jgi:hypothetical protein
MPHWTSWCDYKDIQHNPERSPDSLFPYQYTRAKDAGLKYWETTLKTIALDESRDYLTKGNGDTVGNTTAVLRDRLKIDTYKWLMAKMQPKVYGESIKQEVSGPDGGPVPMINITMHDPKKE